MQFADAIMRLPEVPPEVDVEAQLNQACDQLYLHFICRANDQLAINVAQRFRHLLDRAKIAHYMSTPRGVDVHDVPGLTEMLMGYMPASDRGYSCKLEDRSTGEARRFGASTPVEALIIAMEQRRLSWEHPLQQRASDDMAKITGMQCRRHGNAWDIDIQAEYDGETQLYNLTLLP